MTASDERLGTQPEDAASWSSFVVTLDKEHSPIEGLQAMIEAGQGRLDPGRLAAAADTAQRVGDRFRLSATHTIVALAGATGSGKSSLFNSLTGLDLAAVGVKRPTTSWATACVWNPNGAADLLGWLGVPARNQVSRLSVLDTSPADTELAGLVLLDLPDHDSTEVSHHLEVDRLVGCSDLLVWVLDPQKYADAALHELYLRPHSTHSDVMLVVFNQVDRLTDVERDNTLSDVRRLLAADGLADVPVLATSALRGDGLPELRQALIGRLHAKEAARARSAADVTTAATRLGQHGGTEAMAGSGEGVRTRARNRLAGEVARAAGLDTEPGDTVVRAARAARHAAGWPPLAVFSAGWSAGAAATVTVDRSAVDAALDDYVGRVGKGATTPWLDSLRAATGAGSAHLVEQVAEASRSAATAVKVPVWARMLGVLQVLLLLAAAGSAGWRLFGSQPEVADLPAGWLVAVAAGAVALVLAPLGGLLAGADARRRVAHHNGRTRVRVDAAVDDWVVDPAHAELAAHAAWLRALATAHSG